MTEGARIEFRLLGPLEAVSEDGPIPLGGIRQRALLALLLLRPNEVVARDRLIEELWRDHAPESAANALAALVARLRRALPAETIATRAGGYEVRIEPDALDLDRFERLAEEGSRALAGGDATGATGQLRSALSLWRGPPLADFAYEPFAESTIRRLEELRLAVLENRIDADLALGRHSDLIGELQTLVSEHPLRERFRGQLMLSLYRAGRQAEALQAYRDGRATLLDELGIDPSPALQELERAILRQDPGVRAPEAVLAVDPAPPSPDPEERGVNGDVRPVTILFADIVGAVALADRFAPDEVFALVGGCVTLMSLAAEEYGGAVQAYEGDAICVYFGVPSAHEDDPERAARAALRILAVVDDYARDLEAAWGIAGFAVRVSINTGRAAVGIVGGANRQTLAFGDVGNVASRLRSTAEPGTILVGEATARRLAHRFSFEPLGEIEVRGRKAPVAVSRLLAPSPRAQRSAGAPSLGREHETAQLRSVVDDVRSGRGRVLVVSGATGIGKTHLVSELRSLAEEQVTWLEGRCLSYGGLPGWPFMEILLGWLAAEVGEPEIAIRTKARARLGALLGDALDDVLPPLGLLLRLEPATEAPGEAEIPDAYLRWLEALATERPVVVVLEDVQWADNSTRELADAVMDLTDRAAVALVLTVEPIASPAGAALTRRAATQFAHRTTEIALGPLAEQAAHALLTEILGEDVEPSVRARLVREAEGNPLYLEELARAFQEGTLEPRGRTWTISLRSPELLPPTLENLLAARIDRLASGPRRLAQTAAVIGRTFPVDVLAQVNDEDVADDLAALFRTEVVRELRRYPDFECSFTHGLLQEAALSTLSAAGRRDLYARVAAAFEEVYYDDLGDHLERLAHYHAQAGNLPTALKYAERARAGSAG
jgi:DNA-binding SARP family transcriptional activator